MPVCNTHCSFLQSGCPFVWDWQSMKTMCLTCFGLEVSFAWRSAPVGNCRTAGDHAERILLWQPTRMTGAKRVPFGCLTEHILCSLVACRSCNTFPDSVAVRSGEPSVAPRFEERPRMEDLPKPISREIELDVVNVSSCLHLNKVALWTFGAQC